MLPRALLALSTRGADETIVPHYLTERDHPWLRAALDEHARFVGRRRNELRERMREPLPTPAPKGVGELREARKSERADLTA